MKVMIVITGEYYLQKIFWEELYLGTGRLMSLDYWQNSKVS